MVKSMNGLLIWGPVVTAHLAKGRIDFLTFRPIAEKREKRRFGSMVVGVSAAGRLSLSSWRSIIQTAVGMSIVGSGKVTVSVSG